MHPILKKHLKANKLAHAYLLVGEIDPEEIKKDLLNILGENLSLPHPDFFIFEKDINIELARQIKQQAYSAPLAADKKIFLINAEQLKAGSQNTLLKILEDAPKATHFFLMTSNEENLLSTVRSRTIKLQLRQTGQKNQNIEGFLKAPYKEKLAQISEKGENFIKDLENFIAENKTLPRREKLLDAMQKAYNLNRHKIISPKMYLEYISILLENQKTK